MTNIHAIKCTTPPSKILAVDFNKDNKTDLIWSYILSNSISIATQDQIKDFTEIFDYNKYPELRPLAISNAYNDNGYNVFLLNSKHNQLQIVRIDQHVELHNLKIKLVEFDNPNGEILEKAILRTGKTPYDIAVGPLKQGQDMSFVVTANKESDMISIFTLEKSTNSSYDLTMNDIGPRDVGQNPMVVKISDIDQDGSSDIIVLNTKDSTFSILYGDGSNDFESQKVIKAGNNVDDFALHRFEDRTHIITLGNVNRENPLNHYLISNLYSDHRNFTSYINYSVTTPILDIAIIPKNDSYAYVLLSDAQNPKLSLLTLRKDGLYNGNIMLKADNNQNDFTTSFDMECRALEIHPINLVDGNLLNFAYTCPKDDKVIIQTISINDDDDNHTHNNSIIHNHADDDFAEFDDEDANSELTTEYRTAHETFKNNESGNSEMEISYSIIGTILTITAIGSVAFALHKKGFINITAMCTAANLYRQKDHVTQNQDGEAQPLHNTQTHDFVFKSTASQTDIDITSYDLNADYTRPVSPDKIYELFQESLVNRDDAIIETNQNLEYNDQSQSQEKLWNCLQSMLTDAANCIMNIINIDREQ